MHKFEVGQTTHFIGSPVGAKPQSAEVMACLPPENGLPGYRVKCLDDGRVRHVSEADLRAGTTG